jgi:2-oxoglutarate ferredoxin oxidoreductase subunit alpha
LRITSKLLRRGIGSVKNIRKQCKKFGIHFKKNSQKIVLTGNDAVALGAIAAGMQFAAIYPMTPTSNIWQFCAFIKKYNYIYKQPEDEIAAINMAIGASFAVPVL